MVPMKSTFRSVVFSAGLALALGGCAAGTAPSAEEANNDTKPTADPDQQQQQHLATTSLALEKAYDVQFVKGQVDRDALQPLVNDVLESMPENVRPQAQAHIYDVISKGEKDATEMTPEQRTQLAAPVSADKLGPQEVEQIGAWGWGAPGLGGFGGLGWTGGLGWAGGWGGGWVGGLGVPFGGAGWAGGFGIPFGGVGWAGGFGIPFGGVGWAGGWGGGWATGFASTTFATTTTLGFGGLGFGGLGFGGLGAFGFPGCGFGFGGLGLGLGFGGFGF
jgi:hypothetical protein